MSAWDRGREVALRIICRCDDGNGFGIQYTKFNTDLNWTKTSARDTSYMFMGASHFNGDVSALDVSSVVDMQYMFYKAGAFNGDLPWDTKSCVTMKGMFQSATLFNGRVAFSDTSKVVTMQSMFESARSFDGDLSALTFESVTSMSRMFRDAWAFTDGGIGACRNASCCSCTLDMKRSRVLSLRAAHETMPQANIVRSVLSE